MENYIGIEIFKGDWENSKWTITGYPSQKATKMEFNSAYDFDKFVKSKVNCEGIEFDSESCQFFAYADSKERAESFLKDIEDHFQKIRELM